MSDDLVKRLRSANDESFVETLCGEAANRIEQLTAERDHAWAMAAKADTQMGQSLADHLQAKAERDRLREALRDGRRLWAIAQDDRVRLLIQLEQCEKRHD